MSLELTEKFFADAAGWQAMKEARALLAADRVLSSNWTPPLLKGVVQEGSISYRAGLVIKSERDIENVCGCRQSREWGTLCAHSVGVGLHHLRRQAREALAKAAPAASGSASGRVPRPGKTLPRAPAGPGVEPAELHVIFPPNLATVMARGQVMLCLEASWRGGRVPLNALPGGHRYSFAASDEAFIAAVEQLAGGDTPAMLMPGGKDLLELLPMLAGHPRLTLGKSTPLTVASRPLALPLEARLEPNGEVLLVLAQGATPPVLLEDRWAFAANTLQPAALPESCRDVLRGPLRWRRAQVPVFLSRDWPQLAAAGQVRANFRLEDFTLEPRPPRFLLYLAGGLALLDAHLQCAYGPRIMTVGSTRDDESLWLPDPDSPTRYSTRDLAAEQAALGRLRLAGFTGPDEQGRHRLTGEHAVLNFLAREFPRLQKEWEVTLEERLQTSARQKTERLEPRFEITSSGVQWFDFSVSFEAGDGQRFSAAEIQRLLLSGQSHTRLRNGRIALLDTGAVEELSELLLDCAPEQRDGRYRLAQTQAGFVEATLRAQGWQAQAPAAWRERARQQAGEARLECPPLGELEDVLRPYQKDGVAWLGFLRANGFGGILADEMGLGKTLQALAHLAAIPPAAARLPHLVVCPTSLVFNWQAEAAKFAPRLRVLALHGPERHALFEQVPRHDLIVTSYALIRRDFERYRGVEFDTVILDEAQHIKNRQTQNAQAVKAIRARHRLVLTGTPLENSVLDLWSIFDFLMPGYLGGAKDFRERYEVPITRARDSAAQTRLARRLRPFLLRRLKRDVAKDLPARLEQVTFCELTEPQAAVYRQLMEASRSEVLAAEPNTGRSRMLALNALLRLRQACCDLRLLKLEQTDPATASGKLDLFGELLEEVLDGGHRVLVFSQFVSMLRLLRERLEAEGIDHCYLDGATTDRGAVVGRFQGSSAPVFLISLKAGGTGLNLTGADTVIHFDPWWNPAVEDQATDRAHRLGQTRVVTSYKLIARGTVEEKILQLQQRKRDIIRATLEGEDQFVEALSWEEIQELFAG